MTSTSTMDLAEFLRTFGLTLLTHDGRGAGILAMLLLAIVWRQVKRINIPSRRHLW